jgi:chemotaxis protein MotC
VKGSCKIAAAAVTCALALAQPAQGQNGPGEPFELVRSLQSLQDQIVRGNTRAHANKGKLVSRIAEQFDAIDAERWKEPRNARAAVLFVLNGGPVRALQKLIGSGSGGDLDEKLLKGVLAYGESRMEDALQLLDGIDARLLHVSLGGHVAYVQGELAEKKDPAKAMAHFEDARLLAPGTIVEEAALRRQIALLGAAGDGDRFEVLAGRYLRRFANSIYAGGFRQKFAAALASNAMTTDPDRLARLVSMLSGVATADRRDIYLTIAKEALLKGRVDLAKLAAANAVQLAKEGGDDGEHARLYEGATLIVTDDFDRGIETLSAIERSKLGEHEGALLDVALLVAGQIRRTPIEPEPDSAPPNESDASGAGASQALERARKALAQVDQMLSRLAK